MLPKDIQVGMSVRMKKPHACGNDVFTILRIGADIKIKCARCGHIIMMDRVQFDKRCKQAWDPVQVSTD